MHVHPYGTKHAHKHAHQALRNRRRARAAPPGPQVTPPAPDYPALARLPERLNSWPPVNASHSDAYVPPMASSSS
jgi:hypothetical protein